MSWLNDPNARDGIMQPQPTQWQGEQHPNNSEYLRKVKQPVINKQTVRITRKLIQDPKVNKRLSRDITAINNAFSMSIKAALEPVKQSSPELDLYNLYLLPEEQITLDQYKQLLTTPRKGSNLGDLRIVWLITTLVILFTLFWVFIGYLIR